MPTIHKWMWDEVNWEKKGLLSQKVVFVVMKSEIKWVMVLVLPLTYLQVKLVSDRILSLIIIIGRTYLFFAHYFPHWADWTRFSVIWAWEPGMCSHPDDMTPGSTVTYNMSKIEEKNSHDEKNSAFEVKH